MATPVAPIKMIALVQERRGHGLSTAAFFLARALGNQQIPVLLADLTDRHARLDDLQRHFAAHRVSLWKAPAPWLRDLPALLSRLRQEVGGKVRCVLIDADLGSIEKALHTDPYLALDYLLFATEATSEGQMAADRFAARHEALSGRQRCGVVLARVHADPKDLEDLPQETEGGLPVIGYWPADYRLATSDDYSASGGALAEPHQPYQAAITRLATRVMRLVGLR